MTFPGDLGGGSGIEILGSRRLYRRRASRTWLWALALFLAAAGAVGLWRLDVLPGQGSEAADTPAEPVEIAAAPSPDPLTGPPVVVRSPAGEEIVPGPPPELQLVLEQLAADYGDPVGIAVLDVEDGWVAQVNGDQAFPQQSVSKLWVALAILDAVDRGALSLDTEVVMGTEDYSVFSQPLARRVQEDGPETITVASLIDYAIGRSDNSANDKLVSLVGANRVTDVIKNRKLSGIRLGAPQHMLQSSIAGMNWRPELGLGYNFEDARAELPMELRELAMDAYLGYPLDGASPVGIAQALGALSRGELLSQSSTDYFLTVLDEVTTGPQRLKGGVPEGWRVGHKTGTGQDLKDFTVGFNDVGLLTAPDGKTYAVAVMIRRTTRPNRERMAFMREVSGAVAAYWESQQPAEES